MRMRAEGKIDGVAGCAVRLWRWGERDKGVAKLSDWIRSVVLRSKADRKAVALSIL